MEELGLVLSANYVVQPTGYRPFYLLDDQIEQHGLPEEITHVHDVVPISFDDELIKYMNQCTPKTVTNVLNKICQSSARLE